MSRMKCLATLCLLMTLPARIPILSGSFSRPAAAAALIVARSFSRESDTLLGFSAVRLRTDPAPALIARVNVGAAPIGMIMVNNSRRILIANSNVHNQPGATASLAVISVPAALAHGQALLGVIKTGLVPREFGLERGGRTVLLADNGSGQVQAIDVGSRPRR